LEAENQKSEGENEMSHCTVILLAGGSGKRMNSDRPKQFLEIAGRPLIRYSLDALQKSEIVDECILVAAAGDIPYMKEYILQPGNFTKVRAIAEGGRERFESVLNGVLMFEKLHDYKEEPERIVMVHDGARPYLTEDILERCFSKASEYAACVAAVPSKDTVTIADEDGFEAETPERKYVWNVQTPQAFKADVICSAFHKMADELKRENGLERLSRITDDASVVKYYTGTKICIVRGDYKNMKVTTQDDLPVMEKFLKDMKDNSKKDH
jgi:2-C-methyl-D-erythritol 4-phosphate cytidylyltransferase